MRALIVIDDYNPRASYSLREMWQEGWHVMAAGRWRLVPFPKKKVLTDSQPYWEYSEYKGRNKLIDELCAEEDEEE